jgi:NitT/TauT family transport system permease protein/putative hydroxymethylpyrimidine transport system permease protein
LRRWLPPILLLAALLGAWQAAAMSGALADALDLAEFLVPSPSEIAASLWEDRDLLADNALVTLEEIALGLALAVAAGVALAVVLDLSPTLRRAVYPLIAASQTIPVVAIAPILVVLFGYGIGPKMLLIALICFFPIAVSTADGLRAVDPEAVKMMRTLDASRAQVLLRLQAPGALPHFFSGMRVAAVIAPIGAVFAEWAGSDSGLGHMILQDNAQLETARMFAAVAVLSAIAIALLAALAIAERRVVHWR